jgi:hypothetical protein
MINHLLTKLIYNDTEVTLIGLQIQKSFDNPGLIANVAFQITDSTWCVKMCGVAEVDLQLKNIINQIFEHGCNLDKELAVGMFPFIHLRYEYF